MDIFDTFDCDTTPHNAHPSSIPGCNTIDNTANTLTMESQNTTSSINNTIKSQKLNMISPISKIQLVLDDDDPGSDSDSDNFFKSLMGNSESETNRVVHSNEPIAHVKTEHLSNANVNCAKRHDHVPNNNLFKNPQLDHMDDHFDNYEREKVKTNAPCSLQKNTLSTVNDDHRTIENPKNADNLVDDQQNTSLLTNNMQQKNTIHSVDVDDLFQDVEDSNHLKTKNDLNISNDQNITDKKTTIHHSTSSELTESTMNDLFDEHDDQDMIQSKSLTNIYELRCIVQQPKIFLKFLEIISGSVDGDVCLEFNVDKTVNGNRSNNHIHRGSVKVLSITTSSATFTDCVYPIFYYNNTNTGIDLDKLQMPHRIYLTFKDFQKKAQSCCNNRVTEAESYFFLYVATDHINFLLPKQQQRQNVNSEEELTRERQHVDAHTRNDHDHDSKNLVFETNIQRTVALIIGPYMEENNTEENFYNATASNLEMWVNSKTLYQIYEGQRQRYDSDKNEQLFKIAVLHRCNKSTNQQSTVENTTRSVLQDITNQIHSSPTYNQNIDPLLKRMHKDGVYTLFTTKTYSKENESTKNTDEFFQLKRTTPGNQRKKRNRDGQVQDRSAQSNLLNFVDLQAQKLCYENVLVNSKYIYNALKSYNLNGFDTQTKEMVIKNYPSVKQFIRLLTDQQRNKNDYATNILYDEINEDHVVIDMCMDHNTTTQKDQIVQQLNLNDISKLESQKMHQNSLQNLQVDYKVRLQFYQGYMVMTLFLPVTPTQYSQLRFVICYQIEKTDDNIDALTTDGENMSEKTLTATQFYNKYMRDQYERAQYIQNSLPVININYNAEIELLSSDRLHSDHTSDGVINNIDHARDPTKDDNDSYMHPNTKRICHISDDELLAWQPQYIE